MKKHTLSLCILFLCVCSVSAQTLSGFITNDENEPLEAATVLLIRASDSTLVAGSLSDREGRFSLQITNRNGVFIKVSHIGYQTSIIQSLPANDTVLSIKLSLSQTTLNEVVVSASRINRSATGYTINLKGDEIVKGKNANEVLGFLPGVVNVDGSIMINGVPISTIYINGVRVSNREELKTIVGENIEK